MKVKNVFSLLILMISQGSTIALAEYVKEKDALKFNINESGSHFFQVTFLNQVWLRYNESNPGTLVQNKPATETFDIGLRRTRLQMFGQITDNVFVYFQFGQNNFNAMYNSANGNRKIAPFFHDAVCEYKVSKNNELKFGTGLMIINGLSRFSQPSIATIMTMDVPIFAQATVDQTDIFSRKLSVYARGQVNKLDYRVVVSDPFPINSSGQTPPPISSSYANFSTMGHHKQYQGYVMWQFFEHENHNIPALLGTYLGKKKILNIATGSIFQKDAMWKKNEQGDTLFQPLKLFCVESFLDMPINKEFNSAISAYVGYFNTNYGDNYLRYNGIMNTANGTSLNATNSITGQGFTYGNAYPMFGTGNVIYTQFGYLLPNNLIKMNGQLMPYCSLTAADYKRLHGEIMILYNAGVNWLIDGHKAKVSLDWQNRPTYYVENNEVLNGKRKNAVVLQYQVFF